MPLSKQVRAAASCQTEVILPWSKDKLVDEKFPSTGPVYQELPKPFPGLAGESRSGDANGQWFRVLAAGGTNLVTFGPGVFGTTALPLLGVNPPKPTERPPLDADAPCENQQTPDLRSTPGAPPEQRRIDTNDAAFKARWAKVRKYGIDLMKLSLKREGLADKFKVLDKDITLGRDQEAREGERQVTAIKKNLGNFAAIIGLIVIAAGVVALHPRPAAAALPVLRAEAVPAEGRVLDRAGRRRRPGPDRARLRRAHRRHRRRRPQGRPAPSSRWTSTRSTRTSSTRTRPRCCGPRPA